MDVLTLTSHQGFSINNSTHHYLITPTCFVFRDESDVPVFSLSDQKSVVLEVMVTNMPSDPENPQEDGDDAHNTQLLVSLPNTLSYSGLMGQQVYTCLSDSQLSFFSQSYFSSFPHPDCVVCSCLEGIVWSESERLSGAVWTGQSAEKRGDGKVTFSQLHYSDLRETDHEFFMTGQILSCSEHFWDHDRNDVTVCSSWTVHVSPDFSVLFSSVYFVSETNDVKCMCESHAG